MFSGLLVASNLWASAILAQVTLPVITAVATGTSTRPITAGEAAAHAIAKDVELHTKLSIRAARYPVDSMRAVVTATADRWLSQLQRSSVQGIQLDPAGHVGVAAEHEAYAKASIAARLATPGLSFGDRAYTLRVAVEAFSDVYAPERLPTAEAYLKALDALGDSAACWQFEARRSLMQVYYFLGKSAAVARHGIRAIELVGRMPFTNRDLEFDASGEFVYGATVDALSRLPNARAQIEQLDVVLRAAAVPTPALIAFDSAYYYMGRIYQRRVDQFIAGNAKLGTQGAPLVAHYWLNRPSRDSAILSVNDGKIRVIEVAHTGCPGCILALHGLQRLHEQFPKIETLMLTWTFGYWGNRLVEPEEEVAHLTDYFVTDTKVTIPVGIWAGKKVPNEEGGMTPERGPNTTNYPLFGKPMLWVLDSKGTIRRVFTGYSREIEAQIARTVEFLTREAADPTSQIE